MALTFDVKKTLSLAFLGEGWEQCSLVFRALSMDELEQTLAANKDTNTDSPDVSTILSAMTDRKAEVQAHFISGTAVSGGLVVDVTKDDLGALPAEVIAKAWASISGQPDPNLPTPSNPS